VEGFLDAIKNRKTLVAGMGGCDLLRSATAGVIARNSLPYALPSLRIPYVQNVPRAKTLLRNLLKKGFQVPDQESK
jgi:hypothetical protein